MTPAKLLILDPGHFHAALIQKDMYGTVSPRVAVYAPLTPELLDYLDRIRQFNSRQEAPTAWELDIHTGPDFFERMLRDRAGNAVVITGRNRSKIGSILKSLEAGYHVFADKPWIIASADLPKLALALDTAERKNLVAYDIMTERYEITSILQREIVNTPEVFGRAESVQARSIHHLMKMVAGRPIRRPPWFFDIGEYGEALADVGTHVVDLVQWTIFPGQEIDYRRDVQIGAAKRWPTIVTQAQFEQVTGEREFPGALSPWVHDGELHYFANNSVAYTVKGVPVQLEILWNWEDAGGDVYEAAFQGTSALVEIRQERRPELYVAPANKSFAALRKKMDSLQRDWPGIELAIDGSEAHIEIPDKYRVGHEAHFAQVANQFFQFLSGSETLPAWEKSNMMLKYFVCTRGVEASAEDHLRA